MQILKLQLDQPTTDWQANKAVKQALAQASQIIDQGGLVVYPTETTYGLAVDPGQTAAVNKLLQYKSRREGKPLSIAVSNQEMAERYVKLNQQAQNFYQRFLPGPYTIISQVRDQAPLAAGVASEFHTLGIRIPDYPLILHWLKQLDHGITATGANASNQKRPYKISDILEHTSARQQQLLDLIIDVGQLPHNLPSTVIDTTLSTPLVMRSQQSETAHSDQLLSHSEQDTAAIAGRLLLKYWSRIVSQGLVIGLNGRLGMGKTVFAKAVAQFLGIKDTIVSPTYSYMNEYAYQRHQTQGMFYHVDAWKIDQAAELDQLKLTELVKAGNVLVLEWWQPIANLLPKSLRERALVIELTGQDQDRKLKVWQPAA